MPSIVELRKLSRLQVQEEEQFSFELWPFIGPLCAISDASEGGALNEPAISLYLFLGDECGLN